MSEFLMQNWYVMLALLVVAVVLVINLTAFAALPTQKQLNKVREWLLWAVIEAERELGEGTGQVKLRSVYDRFLRRFPQLAIFISFERFALLVDEALEKMQQLLEENDSVKKLVEGWF